jgi:hypothetical protein
MLYDKFIESQGVFAEDLKFLAKAVSDDECRYFMAHIYIEPSMIPDEWWKRRGEYRPKYKGTSTDGYRLHIVDPLPNDHEFEALSPGFWKVMQINKKHVQIAHMPNFQGQFPNYQNAIPTEDILHSSQFCGFSLQGNRAGESSREISKFFRSFPKPTPINLNYIADIGLDRYWAVDWRGNDKSVVFTSKERTAIIMPMMAEEE